MTHLNEPIAAGASRVLVTFLGASSSAIRRGTVAILSVTAATRMATATTSGQRRFSPIRQVPVWMSLNAVNNVYGNMFRSQVLFVCAPLFLRIAFHLRKVCSS